MPTKETTPPSSTAKRGGHELPERDIDSICPMRRLAREPPSSVLAEFSQRIQDMPPDHVMLLRKFQEDEKLKAKIDSKLGGDKEAMLAHLWETHKNMFRPLSQDDDHAANVQQWLETLQEPPSDAPDLANSPSQNGDGVAL
ncbi:hypothetical protein FH972_022798 [Carpinus fangiana]|uniref:Uncharacterized protein n=1 Tax=Carpinus fangiana TaxID=176857 RepID=A0A5N6KTA0_9ROSI|nr:hypothetical protein FH972_022798 [Carpinus fangiana]